MSAKKKSQFSLVMGRFLRSQMLIPVAALLILAFVEHAGK